MSEERAVPIDPEQVKKNQEVTERALRQQRDRFHEENPGETCPGQTYRVKWAEGQYEKIFGKKNLKE